MVLKFNACVCVAGSGQDGSSCGHSRRPRAHRRASSRDRAALFVSWLTTAYTKAAAFLFISRPQPPPPAPLPPQSRFPDPHVTTTVTKQPLWRVIPHLRIPGTIPGGCPDYPDPLRGGFVNRGRMLYSARSPSSARGDGVPLAWLIMSVLGSWVGERSLFHLSVFLTASRTVLPQGPSTSRPAARPSP